MSSTIIDETVILRYLLDDDEVLSPRAAKVIATRTARVYPEIITRVVVTLRDVYKVPRVEIATAMKRLLDDVMVDEPPLSPLPSNSLARPIWTLPTASSQPEPPSTTMMS